MALFKSKKTFRNTCSSQSSLDPLFRSEYAGLFSNNDKLSNQLINVGEIVEEKVWRMPLHDDFDKELNWASVDLMFRWHGAGCSCLKCGNIILLRNGKRVNRI